MALWYYANILGNSVSRSMSYIRAIYLLLIIIPFFLSEWLFLDTDNMLSALHLIKQTNASLLYILYQPRPMCSYWHGCFRGVMILLSRCGMQEMDILFIRSEDIRMWSPTLRSTKKTHSLPPLLLMDMYEYGQCQTLLLLLLLNPVQRYAKSHCHIWKRTHYFIQRKPFTTVKVSPSPSPDTRYLMATSEDGSVRLWKWDKDTLQFLDVESPIAFYCKFKGTDRARCSSFNYTGTRFAVGGDDGFVYIFTTVKSDAGKKIHLYWVIIFT